MMTIKRADSNNKDFYGLVAKLDEDLTRRYGTEQLEYDRYNKIKDIDTIVLAYINDEPVGCGCFKTFDNNSVEVKRMFVETTLQGKGIGKAILKELEKWAAEIGYHSMVLETGTRQPEAIHLYQKLGYRIIPNFNPYIGNELSVCMKKDL